MPRIQFNGDEWHCEEGESLRDALLARGHTPHNGAAHYLNCRGLGSCGTCAVRIEPRLNQPLTSMEKWRLRFPPHQSDSGLRLACQVKVCQSIKVIKHQGFWGEKVLSE